MAGEKILVVDDEPGVRTALESIPSDEGYRVTTVESAEDGLAAVDRGMGLVTVDAQQMRRVLINLIDNAVAAMNERGTIRVSARSLGGDGSVRIEIVDSGPGIPPADRDKMFAPYFSTKKRGTGIGLAIVHKVITDHRGTIRVEDNVPRGARFVIEIPTGTGSVTQ